MPKVIDALQTEFQFFWFNVTLNLWSLINTRLFLQIRFQTEHEQEYCPWTIHTHCISIRTRRFRTIVGGNAKMQWKFPSEPDSKHKRQMRFWMPLMAENHYLMDIGNILWLHPFLHIHLSARRPICSVFRISMAMAIQTFSRWCSVNENLCIIAKFHLVLRPLGFGYSMQLVIVIWLPFLLNLQDRHVCHYAFCVTANVQRPQSRDDAPHIRGNEPCRNRNDHSNNDIRCNYYDLINSRVENPFMQDLFGLRCEPHLWKINRANNQ